MLKSYVGMASRRGLLALAPESEPLVRHLIERAAQATRGAAVCLWAVMSAEEADRVTAQLDSGDFGPALVTLNQEAVQLGPIYPG